MSLQLLYFCLLFSAAAVLFASLLRLSGAVTDARRALDTLHAASTVLRDPALSDRDKEVRLQAASRDLFGRFLRLFGKAALALALPLLLLSGLTASGLLERSALLGAGGDPRVIAVSSIVALLALALPR